MNLPDQVLQYPISNSFSSWHISHSIASFFTLNSINFAITNLKMMSDLVTDVISMALKVGRAAFWENLGKTDHVDKLSSWRRFHHILQLHSAIIRKKRPSNPPKITRNPDISVRTISDCQDRGK